MTQNMLQGEIFNWVTHTSLQGQLLKTLDLIHSKGVLYADLLEENILVDNDRIIFFDFGNSSTNASKVLLNKERQYLLRLVSYQLQPLKLL